MGEVQALVGGPGTRRLTADVLEPVEEWVASDHHKTHDVALIFAGVGPRWVLCLDCEWSEDVPEGVECP